jgi:hypothetical protein
LRVTESYIVQSKIPVYTHCIKASELKNLMRLFPDAMSCFLMKAIDRRTEFRRIKKLFQLYSGTTNPELMERVKVPLTFNKLKDSQFLDHKEYTIDD